MVHLLKISTLQFALLFAFAINAQEGPKVFNFDGQLTDSAGTPVTANTTIRIQILDASGTCTLYGERHALTGLSASNGRFSVIVGSGAMTGVEPANSFENVFKNSGSLLAGNAESATCASGGTYTPANLDKRQVQVHVEDGMGNITESFNAQYITSVPFAMMANNVSGFKADNLLRVENGSGPQTATALTPANFTELLALINGTSSNYIDSTPGAAVNMNSQRVTNVATPTAGTDAANKLYCDTNLGGVALNTAGVTSGQVLSYNGTQWVATTPAATLDATKLPLAGGTMSGSITMSSNDLANVGNINISDSKFLGVGKYATDPTGWGASEKGRVWFNTTSNTFKYWDGTDARVISHSMNTVSGVSATAPLASTGGLTPDISITANGITAAHIGPDAVSLSELADGAVDSAAIVDGAVTDQKIAGVMVNKILSNTGVQFTYAPNGTECTVDQVLKWKDTVPKGWICGTPAAGNVGTVTNVTAFPPLSVATGNSTPAISMTPASAGVDGYLTGAKYNDFNAKLNPALPDGQVFVGNSGTAAGRYLNVGDIRSTVNTAFPALPPSGCGAGQYWQWNMITGVFDCTNISISSSQVSNLSIGTVTTVSGAGMITLASGSSSVNPTLGLSFGNGLQGTSTLTVDPGTGITVDTNGVNVNVGIGANQIPQYDASGNLGVGNASPAAKLDVAGSMKIGNGGEVCNGGIGAGGIRYNLGNLEYCNGTSWQVLGVSGAGITGLTGEIVATGAGSVNATISPNAVTTSKINDGAVTLQKLAPSASPSVLIGRNSASAGNFQEVTLGAGLSMDSSGVLSNTFVDTNSGGTVTSVTVAGGTPLTVTGTNAVSISLTPASSGVSGYLTGANWDTFNNKLSSSLSNGMVFRGDAGGVAQPSNLRLGDIKDSTAGNAFPTATCVSSGNTLVWQSPADNYACVPISITSSQISDLTVGDGTVTNVVGSGVISISGTSTSVPTVHLSFGNGLENSSGLRVKAGAGISVTAGGVNIATGGVTSAMIGDDQIEGNHLADGSVSSSQIADDAVTSTELANNAVDTAAIANNAVTFSKMSMIPQNTLLGQFTTASGVPGPITIPDCNGTTAKLIWTAGSGFGCGTDTGSAGVVTSVAPGTTAIQIGGTGTAPTVGLVLGNGLSQAGGGVSIASGGVTSGMISDGTITLADMASDSVDFTKLIGASAGSVLVGRNSTGPGDFGQITLGAGLTMSGSGVLSSTITDTDTIGINQLTGDVTTPASSSGSTASTVVSIAGVSAANVSVGVTAANNATSTNTASRIVLRNASGDFSANDVTLNQVSSINTLVRGSTSGAVTIQAPAATVSSYVLRLPANDGNLNDVLSTDGNGILSWVSQPAAQWTVSGSDIYRSSNVGINAAPATNVPLHVEKNQNGIIQMVVKNSSTGNLASIETAYTNNLGEFVVGLNGSNYSNPVADANAGFIWNKLNGPIILATNDTEKMRILPNGNVGIGTSSPVHKLEVATNGKSISAITAYSSAIATDDAELILRRARNTQVSPAPVSAGDRLGGVFFSGYESGGWAANSAAVVGVAKENFSTAGSNGGYLAFETTETGTSAATSRLERMRIDHDGDVGIGTQDPKTKLDVAGGIKVGNEPDACAIDLYGTFRWNGSAMQFCNSANNWVTVGSGAGDVLSTGGLEQFATNSTTSAELANIMSDETGTGSMVFNINPTLSGSVTVPMIVGGNAVGSNVIYKSTTGNGTGTAGGHIFTVGNNGGTEALRILNNGNIGVGTTDPNSALEVKGEIKFRDTASSNAVGLKAPALGATGGTYTLPATMPSLTGQVLSATTSGVMSWTTAGNAMISGGLGQFTTTSSSSLGTVLSDETGSGLVVFNANPSFSGSITTPLMVGDEVRFRDADTNYISMRSPSNITVNGTYTLPMGMPTITGQVLSSTTAGVMSWVPMSAGGPPFAPGTVTIPGINFSSSTNTGLYSPIAGTAAIATNGTHKFSIDALGNSAFGPTNAGIKFFSVDPGSSAPSGNGRGVSIFAESTSGNSTNGGSLDLSAGNATGSPSSGGEVNIQAGDGMTAGGNVNIASGTGGSVPGKINLSGKVFANNSVGIGISTPVAMLDVNGPFKIGTSAACTSTEQYVIRRNGMILEICNGAGTWTSLTAGGSSQWTTAGSDIHYMAGNVGIGTTTPADKLEVKGNLRITAASDATYNILRSPAGSPNFTYILPQTAPPSAASHMLVTNNTGVMQWQTVPAGTAQGTILTSSFAQTAAASTLVPYAPPSGTLYLFGSGSSTIAGGEPDIQMAVPRGGTIKNFYLRTTSAGGFSQPTGNGARPLPDDEELVCTVRKNGVNTALQVKIPEGTPNTNTVSFFDTTNSFLVSPGDLLSVACVNEALSNSHRISNFTMLLEW